MSSCPRCGKVYLDQDSLDFLPDEGLGEHELSILSICLRNDFERRGKRPSTKAFTIEDLKHMILQYRTLDPLEKMDNALFILEKATPYIGAPIEVPIQEDYPYYHCSSQHELANLFRFLCEEILIGTKNKADPHTGLWIAPRGYERLRELRKTRDSRQCFVAMWLDPSMTHVFEDAIRPAIEYLEEGATTSRFKTLRIDNKEHTNDINDEIISEIRRSRFMVCDLTGYRGGVYFEAGFAYGLGLEVIYTCREDWIKQQIKKIVDKDGVEHSILRDGIHFDLEHRNRIAWSEDKLHDLKKALTDRIKAVIV